MRDAYRQLSSPAVGPLPAIVECLRQLARVALLMDTGIPNPLQRAFQWISEFSNGTRSALLSCIRVFLKVSVRVSNGEIT